MWKHDRFVEAPTLVLLLLTVVAGFPCFAVSLSAPSFGINYGKIANNLPPPSQVVSLIQSISITKSKLYDADPLVLRTFGNTGISFIVGTANDELLGLANPAVAESWVQSNVAAYLPSTNIIGIVVGNEIFSGTDTNQMSQVLPAMKNVYSAIKALGLENQIFVSTAHSYAVITSSYPPSAGAFSPAIANLYIKPVLEFLSQTGAPFLINVYPFFAYKDSPNSVSLEYVLFQPNLGVKDSATGLTYFNMFDAQMDAVYSAMAALGYNNLTLLVSETGWPSAGDANEHGATIQNAQTYHTNLVQHLDSHPGTPLKPNLPLEVYLFALFNEDMKPGPTSERNYGLFKPDGTKVYNFGFVQLSSHYSATAAVLKVGSFLSVCTLLSILVTANVIW